MSAHRLDHEARAARGDMLDRGGDTRLGVGVRPAGIPGIAWCAVNVPPDMHGVPCPFHNERGVVYGEFTLNPFYIARFPVTFGQFETFVHAPDGFHNAAWWQTFPVQYHHQPILAQRTPMHNHPRDGVSWFQATAFTRWLNAKMVGEFHGIEVEIRLPTEWEWQHAAQGNDGRAYPWGNSWDHAAANTREARLGRTTAVGMYPHGAAWCGAEDMSGGVWEWCLNEYKNPHSIDGDETRSRVLRGGSFVDAAEWAVCGSRFNDLPNRRLDYFGFRVAAVPKIEDAK